VTVYTRPDLFERRRAEYKSPPPRLDDAVLMNLANITRVPKRKWESFFAQAEFLVESYIFEDQNKKLSGEHGGKLGHVMTKAKALLRALDRLNDRDVKILEEKLNLLSWVSTESWDDDVWKLQPSNTREVRIAIEYLASVTSYISGKKLKQRPRVKGGQRQGSKHFVLRCFALELMHITHLAGGRLSPNQFKKTGSLTEALNALRDYLPPGLIPTPLPYSTLEKLNYRKEIAARPWLARKDTERAL